MQSKWYKQWKKTEGIIDHKHLVYYMHVLLCFIDFKTLCGFDSTGYKYISGNDHLQVKFVCRVCTHCHHRLNKPIW